MISQLDSAVPAIVFGLIGLLAFVLVLFYLRLNRDLASIREALKGTSGESLERLLVDHTRGRLKLEEENRELQARVAELEQKAKSNIGSVGLVRYDAFEEMGGDQSFAVAFQNEAGDGVVFNSITGRQQVKIYCKPLRGGQSDHALTPEEEQAIRNAQSRDMEARLE
ncbi:MAG: DUF4446 family protein [Fimbriimonadales bacterium]|nr:DUF4446 family protein [Fimbriimonadales bacterium]